MAPGLTADWALWGKVPYTTRGYEVLATHPPSRSGEFNAAIQHWYPGTPSSGDRLPWITIGCTPDSAGTGTGTGTVGVFLLDATSDRDIVHRPVHRISHFAVPYAQIRETGIGWWGLARAARTAAESLGETSTGPAELAFGEKDLLVNDIADHITPGVSATTRWLAAAAAYLLDGPVAVAAGNGFEPLVVLRTLDAVAALLPFGVRSTLSAATSTSRGARVPMRLFWGDPLGARGVTKLPLSGELPDLDGLSPQARTYHDLLLENWTEDGGEAVVRHLAEARAPLDVTALHTTGQALEVLGARNRELAAKQALTDLTRGLRAAPHTGDETSAGLTARVLPDAHADLEAVAPHLSEDAASQAFRTRLRDELLHDRKEAALASFEQMRTARTAAGLDLDPLDRILAGVMAETLTDRAPGDPDPVTGWLLPGVIPFAPGSMGLTRSVLRRSPGLAGRLVRTLYDRPEAAQLVRAWLRWLCDEPRARRRAEIAGSAELPVLHAMLSCGPGTGLAEAGAAGGRPASPARRPCCSKAPSSAATGTTCCDTPAPSRP